MANYLIDSLAFGGNTNVFTLPYGTCSTAAATAAKVVTVNNFTLDTGARVAIKFTNGNSVATPTLNINSTGAKTIYYKGASLKASDIIADQVYEFLYDGTNWNIINTVDVYTKAESDALFAANDAMLFKGTLGTNGTITALPTTYEAGWTYRVITAGTYAGKVCEVGDLIIAIKDCYSSASASTDDWTVAQTNIDGAVTGPTNSTDAHVAIFNGTSGKIIKDSGFTIGSSVPANAKFTDTVTTVDSVLSSTSENPVQNKVIALSLNDKMDKVNPTGSGAFSLNRLSNRTIGDYSFAEGYNTTASGESSHAEGSLTEASGNQSHAEGGYTTASGESSHAEGNNTTASGSIGSHAEGYSTTASGHKSHAEGSMTTASGESSHAEGNGPTASADSSHAEGQYTTANSRSQHVQGEYNIIDTQGSSTTRGTYAHIVGNGTSDTARSNAHTLDWDGNAWYAGKVTVSIATPTEDLDLTTKKYVDDSIMAKFEEYGTIHQHTFTAVAAQTTFTIPYSYAASELLMVYYNGILLTETENYTVSGQVITLNGWSANAGDLITAISLAASAVTSTTSGNDYAEYRTANILEAGRCVIETGDDNLVQSTKRLQPGANIISDTYGVLIGEENGEVPIAVAGRVLAYPLEDRKLYRKAPGMPVCSGPNGTISLMSREEAREYPECIVGYVSAVPKYKIWGDKNIKINGRVWIKVK